MGGDGPARRVRTARWAVVSLCGVQFVDVLGVTAAIAAIPAIIRGLSAPPETTGLLATVYAAFFGGLLVLGSRLGDKYGPRRVLVIGLALFTAVAFPAATAHRIGQLLAAIALEGAAAALSVPCALRLLLHVATEPRARRTALAAWSATGAVAGVLGYVIGGVLTEVFGWQAIYAVYAPIGVFLLAAVLLCVPSLAAVDRYRPLDLVGAVLLVAAVMALIVGASLIERPELLFVGLGSLAAGVLIILVFIGQQRRARSPLIPPAAARSRNLRSGSLVSLVNTATTSSAGVLATLLLQQHLGLSPLQAAFTLLPFSLAVIAGSVLSRPLGARLPEQRLCSVGLGGIAAGNLILALTAGHIAGLVAGVVVAGVGLGTAAVAATSLGTRVSDDLTGSATGLLNTAAQLGTALGVAALVTIASIASPPTGTAIAWAAGGATAALAGLILLTAGEGGGKSGTRCCTPSSPEDPSGPGWSQTPLAGLHRASGNRTTRSH
jgi:MFS family permease